MINLLADWIKLATSPPDTAYAGRETLHLFFDAPPLAGHVTPTIRPIMTQLTAHEIDALEKAHLESLLLIETMKNQMAQSPAGAPLYTLATPTGADQQTLADLRAQNERLLAQRDALKRDLETALSTQAHLEKTIGEHAAHIEQLYCSNSWRITAPLRALSRLTKNTRG